MREDERSAVLGRSGAGCTGVAAVCGGCGGSAVVGGTGCSGVSACGSPCCSGSCSGSGCGAKANVGSASVVSAGFSAGLSAGVGGVSTEAASRRPNPIPALRGVGVCGGSGRVGVWCIAKIACSISAREAPWSAICCAFCTISFVIWGMIRVSERSSPLRRSFRVG